MIVRPFAASILALMVLCAPASARVLSGTRDSSCETCLFSMHLLDDILCDSYVDDQAAQWLVDNVCAHMGSNKDACVQMVTALMPVAVEWLRANLSPEGMCTSVCPKPSLADVAKKQLRAAKAQANDATCSLCMFVVGKVKEVLSDPATQEEIHQQTTAACGQLPEGAMRDMCTQWAEQYETVIFKYVNDLEAEDVCQMAGTCQAAALLRAPKLAPLRPQVVQALAGLVALAKAPPSNDNCETCKLVIQQIHQVVANPDLQQQMVDYAKQACTLVASVATQCQADVDQYAPMVFGMILAYLQPLQVCQQLDICPPPSAQQQLGSQVALSSALAAVKFKTALSKAPAQVATS